jgi:hypothetical protein
MTDLNAKTDKHFILFASDGTIYFNDDYYILIN